MTKQQTIRRDVWMLYGSMGDRNKQFIDISNQIDCLPGTIVGAIAKMIVLYWFCCHSRIFLFVNLREIVDPPIVKSEQGLILTGQDGNDKIPKKLLCCS